MITHIVRIRAIAGAALLLSSASPAFAQSQTPIADKYRETANKLIAAALADSSAWNRLAALTDKFGHRLSGSQSLERAIDWIIAEMRKDGLQNVRGEPVMVPHWVRGEESATLITPRRAALHMIGLGRSVGTPKAGITAQVMVVNDFAELTRRASEAPGKIVLFDEPFGALDPLTRASLQREFADVATRLRKTAILVTHDVREALILARRIGLMHKGRLLLLETPEQFLASDHPQVRAYLETLELKGDDR